MQYVEYSASKRCKLIPQRESAAPACRLDGSSQPISRALFEGSSDRELGTKHHLLRPDVYSSTTMPEL